MLRVRGVSFVIYLHEQFLLTFMGFDNVESTNNNNWEQIKAYAYKTYRPKWGERERELWEYNYLFLQFFFLYVMLVLSTTSNSVKVTKNVSLNNYKRDKFHKINSLLLSTMGSPLAQWVKPWVVFLLMNTRWAGPLAQPIA